MKTKKFGLNAMFGIKEDGTVECLEIGNFCDDHVSENTAEAWGCTEIYFRNDEEMTDEELEKAQFVFNLFFGGIVS